jgi:hypothetical protein
MDRARRSTPASSVGRKGIWQNIFQALASAGGPPAQVLIGGQVADCTAADTLLDAMPKTGILHGDKGYDSNAVLRTSRVIGGRCRRSGIWSVRRRPSMPPTCRSEPEISASAKATLPKVPWLLILAGMAVIIVATRHEERVGNGCSRD